MLGTANEPIDLLANGNGEGAERNLSECRITKDQSSSNASYPLVSKNRAHRQQQYILLEDDEKDGDELFNALARSLRRLPMADDELIDLEDIEDDLLQSDGQALQIEDAYLGDARQESRRSSRVVRIEARNPAIILPLMRKETLKHLGSTLKANKTVEFRNGNFLRIKDIIINAETDEVTLRGHRMRRTRDMNGMLPKKMNECLLFFEVDINDDRDPLEQAVVETPLAEVVQLRSVRYTNERFPLNRNIDPKEFINKDVALETGGLTSRWKYTCRYASAISRYHNSFAERSLERLTPEECTKGYYSSDVARRFKWRGETIPGGAFQPTIYKEQAILLPESREGSVRTEKVDDFALVNVYSIDDSSSDEGENLRSSTKERNSRASATKRKHSEMTICSSAQTSGCDRGQKKVKHMEEKSVKKTREGISRMNLQPDEKRGSKTNSKVIDLSSQLFDSIDLTLSDLATPPKTGSIRTKSGTPRVSVKRTAGQKLTYGDSFCGAGGATRGAAMAGLRVLWGFDFWKQACTTWEANFPDARCFHKPAHKFVEFAKRYPLLVKVDILHLSPPCQFFSPAHTVNGADDEMNTASLFAVQAVIEVAKPRIVTLEQTFGITHPRFRFYFNALIQMFTAHDFAVRWAVVPLAQWVRPHPLSFHQRH
jgi:DNA (cytosine-5)-methyltransferase 1